jgi:hypothetical protein
MKPADDEMANDLSTNVSSPVRRKRRRAAKAAEPEVGPDGYARDSFVVDESDDDNYFEPVPAKAPTTYRAARRPASPEKQATVLEASLEHQCAIDGFLAEAKKWCLDLVVKEKLRKQPFSDTVLHEVAIRMPSTIGELQKVSGICPDMARSYGAYLLRLVVNMKALCGEISQADNDRNDAGAWPSSSGATSKPYDPNHEVYVISDDEEEHVVSDSDKEDRVVGRSRFFGGDAGVPALDPAVADFNNMIGGPKRRAAPASRAPAAGGNHVGQSRATGPRVPASRPAAAASGAPSKPAYVRKKYAKGGGRRQASGAAASRGARAARGGSRKKTPGGSGFNAGGIGMMPT